MHLGYDIEINDDVLAALCVEYGVERLAVFGSVLTDRFTDASDVDVLVEFKPGLTPGLLRIAEMELQLESLIGRRVDLRTYGDLSRYFRDEVIADAKPIYAA